MSQTDLPQDAPATVAPATKPWTVWQQFVVCQVWAFALFLPVTVPFTSANTRYFMFWDSTKLLFLFGATCFLGVVIFAVGGLLRRFLPERFSHISGSIALVSLVTLLWSYVSTHYIHFKWLVLSPVALLFMAILTGIVMGRGWTIERLGNGLAKAALFMAFLIPIFWVTCLTYTCYPQGSYPALADIQERTPSTTPGDSDNIYIFVFDEWSYRLTFRDGRPHPHLKSLSAFSDTSYVFTNAHSPGCHTVQALPKILFESNDTYLSNNGTLGFSHGEQFRACLEMPSIFTKAREQGYRTYMVGFHHPYPVMLGENVDYAYARSYCWAVDRATPVETVGAIYWDWGNRLIGSGLCERTYFGDDWVKNKAGLQLANDLQERTLAVLGDNRSSPQFAVFHLPFPHAPFIFRADGTVRDLRTKYPDNCPLFMRDHIANLDRVVGQFLSTLRKQGKLNNSTIVFTSDHTFRNDPDQVQQPDVLTHVPLMIHMAGQQKAVRVDEPFTTSYLMALLNELKNTQDSMGTINVLVSNRNWYHPVEELEENILPSISR